MVGWPLGVFFVNDGIPTQGSSPGGRRHPWDSMGIIDGASRTQFTRFSRFSSYEALALVASGTGVARAQSLTNGALRGVALYATESTPIVGVQITVEGSDGRPISFLETDGSGLFTVPLLAPGTYRVLAEQVGLQPVRLTGVATVTAGGGGAPVCCWRSLQLTTKVATANSTASFRRPCITENDDA